MEPEIAFGFVLRKLRHERGLSQEALALDAELQRNYISLLERGENSASVRTIFKLSKALSVSAKDFLGYPRKPLKGTASLAQTIEQLPIYLFEEKRGAGEVSLDRLGRSSRDKKVLRNLEPLATDAGKALNPPCQFLGWVVARAGQVRSPEKGPTLQLFASPTVKGEQGETVTNEYHSHVMRPQGYGHYEMAMHLKEIFARGSIEHCGSAPSASAAPLTAIGRIASRILRFISSLF